MKIYLVTDYSGELYMNDCGGRAIKEDGEVISGRHETDFKSLRKSLMKTINNPEQYEIIDLLDKEIPEQFKLF